MNTRRQATGTAATGTFDATQPSNRGEAALLLFLVIVPVLFNALTLLPELRLSIPSDNDNGLHYLMIKGASDALAHGQNALDFWAPQLDLGFPQFLYYQNLPHLLLAGLHRLLLGRIGLLPLFNASRYLLMLGLPVTVYWSLRRMRFSMAAAAMSAAAASLISGKAGYGLEFNSYTWAGRGLYTQLWAIHLSFIALTCLHRLMETGRGHVAAILALACLAMTNFVYAYMMAMTGIMVFLAISDRATFKANAARLGMVGLAAVALSSFMLVPFALDSGRYLAIPPGIKNADFDALSPISSLLDGTLMDFGRLPVLSVLTLLGAIAAGLAIATKRNRAAMLALGGFLAWLLLYQLRPDGETFAGRVLHYDGNLIFRFVGSLEMFAVILIGLGGEWLWQGIGRLKASIPFGTNSAGAMRRLSLGPLLAFVVVVMVLIPAINERGTYYSRNREYMVLTYRAVANDRDLRAILDSIQAHPGGRTYIGNRHNWGASMNVGPLLKGYDLLRYSGLDAVTLPFQGLSLNTGMIWDFKDNDPAKYDLLDVRYAIGPTQAAPPAFFIPFVRTDRYTAYHVPTTGIATYGTVTARQAVATREELSTAILSWSHSPAPAQRQFIRWDYMAPGGTLSAPAACPDGGHTLSEQTGSGAVHLVVECTSAATLVLKMTYHPNWQLRVDGRPTTTYMVSPSYIAVDLPPGRHQVDAQYIMAPYRWALLAFGLCVLVLSVVFRRQLDWLPSRLDGRALPATAG